MPQRGALLALLCRLSNLFLGSPLSLQFCDSGFD
jgi:hypothetical protein